MESASHNPEEDVQRRITLNESLICSTTGVYCGQCKKGFSQPENLKSTSCPYPECGAVWLYIAKSEKAPKITVNLELQTVPLYAILADNYTPRLRFSRKAGNRRNVNNIAVSNEFL